MLQVNGIRKTFLPALLLVTWGTSGAFAGLIITLTAAVTPEASGLFLYNYTLENQLSSDLPVVGLSISVDSAANLAAITGPTGWNNFYLPSDTIISWESPDLSTDLLPGEVTAFTFLSALKPGLRDYLVVGLDELNSRVENSIGQIEGPSPAQTVPEPSTLTMLASLGVLLGFIRRPRKPAESLEF